jgi:predicted phage terminase large subunit-like protein
MSSRLNNKQTGAMVIIMQRLHERDLAGHVLERGGYEHVCLPTRFEPERRCVTILDVDPRQQPGRLLFPGLFPAEVVDEIENKELGPSEFAGQHQQRPSPEGGGILKKHWWRYWQPKGSKLSPVVVRKADGESAPIEAVELPDFDSLDIILQSWDCSFKDVASSDFVVGLVVGKKGPNKYVLDRVRDRMDCPTTIAAVQKLSEKWPRAMLKLIEDKANGTAVIQMLRTKLPGLKAVEPEGGKVNRAYAVSPQVETGNVYLPHPLHANWVDSLIEEYAAFPNGAYDDQVDALTQALHRLANKPMPNVRRTSEPWEQH